MTIRELCEGICLPAQATQQVLDFAAGFDFAAVEGMLARFASRQEMMPACEELRASLGEDENGMKILACQLKASADLYARYQEAGMSNEVYFATMACYTRFMKETLESTGKLIYDRWWWTVRQAGFQLFRVGDPEYELVRGEKETYIDMHIPSDADFSPEAVDASLAMSREFMQRFFPEMAQCDYCCHSWLLSPEMRDMLREGSRILSFQDRFEILGVDEENMGAVSWVFPKKVENLADLPENTSLQRCMKAHLLADGEMHGTRGRLKTAR